mgnify:CR=1 FL=1
MEGARAAPAELASNATMSPVECVEPIHGDVCYCFFLSRCIEMLGENTSPNCWKISRRSSGGTRRQRMVAMISSADESWVPASRPSLLKIDLPMIWKYDGFDEYAERERPPVPDAIEFDSQLGDSTRAVQRAR